MLKCFLLPVFKVLLFPRNLFSSLSWSSFQSFTAIYEIDLTANKVCVRLTPEKHQLQSNIKANGLSCLQVPEVPLTSSPALPTLRVLRLTSNLLTSLPDHSFSACPGLTELYLDGNNIGSLSDHTFSGLSKLEVSTLAY